MVTTCATLGCEETAGLEAVPGADGKLCAACRVELALLVEQIGKEATERDRENERRRID